MTIKEAFQQLANATKKGMKNPFFIMRSLNKNFSEIADKIEGGTGGINYSTDEQDTGLKWIDGSKIYQKTFYFTPTGVDTNIDVADLNINELIHRFGVFTRTTESVVQQKAIEYRTENPSDSSYGIQCELRGTNLFTSINGYIYSYVTNIRVTIQYTKTAS